MVARHDHRGPRLRLLPVLLVALTLSLLPSCSSSSPSATVKAIYEAANEVDYERFESYYSEDMAEAMEGGMGRAVGGTQGLADWLTRGGIVQKVEITDEEIRGEGAEVSYRVYYGEAEQQGRNEGDLFGEENPEARDLTLAQEGGSWKMSVANFTQ
jgi:hypothetical protein